MQEECRCGGSIRTLSYKRVRQWRATHPCADPDNDIDGPSGAEATTETARQEEGRDAGTQYVPMIRMGFQPERAGR